MLLVLIGAGDPALSAEVPAAVKTSGEDRAQPWREAWLAVTLNGLPSGDVVLALLGPGGEIHVRASDLERWRRPASPPEAGAWHEGERYVPLNVLPGLSYRLQEREQVLLIDAPAASFRPTTIRVAPRSSVEPKAPRLGAFLNYDLTAVRSDDEPASRSALFEANLFSKAGSGISRFLHIDRGVESRGVRLETTWTFDRPRDTRTLRLGDAITSASRWWGGAVRFGGVQWSSNFDLQPGLVTLPLPRISGEVTVPSAIDLYIDGVLRSAQPVPAGPFSIHDVPIVTGRGDIRVVVRDLLGREQVITQEYYASPDLLRPGLHDYSYELGFERENYAVHSSDYGAAVLAGTHRVGLTERLTAEVHGELLRDRQTLGIGGAFLLPRLGVISMAAAGSRGKKSEGGLFMLGFDRASRQLSVGGTVQVASPGFRSFGTAPDTSAPRVSSRLSAHLSLGAFGSLGLAHVYRSFRERAAVEFLSAQHSVRIGKLGFLSLNVTRVLSSDPDTVVGLSFTRALDNRTSTGVSSTLRPDGTQGMLQLQRSLPSGDGVGYRLRAGVGETDLREAAMSWQAGAGTWSLEAVRSQGTNGLRASASGSIAVLGKKVFASRRIDDSFAVVDVDDYADVRVYRENQLVGRTNARGSLLVPGLRAYQNNLVRIEQADLPLALDVPAAQVKAAPFARSGLFLSFPVRRPRGALLSIVLENGAPVPPGARVRIVGEGGAKGREFPVALRGEAYVEDLARTNRLRVHWRGRSCEFSVTYPAGDEPLPHLGPCVCVESTP